MTTVHEAAIANGWDPADGSPWVGPDGVTYPSKDAFYEAAEVDPMAATTCPSWCDRAHDAGDVHRAVLWTDEQFDMKRVQVSLVNYEAAGDTGDTEVGLQISDDDKQLELWLSWAMVGELVQQLTHALVMAAVETAEANR